MLNEVVPAAEQNIVEEAVTEVTEVEIEKNNRRPGVPAAAIVSVACAVRGS